MLLSGDFELVDSDREHEPNDTVDAQTEGSGEVVESGDDPAVAEKEAPVVAEKIAEDAHEKGATEQANIAENAPAAADAEPAPSSDPLVVQPQQSLKKSSSSKSARSIAKIAEPSPVPEEEPTTGLLSKTSDLVSQAISSSEKVGVAVASAASSMVPPDGLDSHTEQSTSELATEASRSTAALATKLMEESIDTATRVVERSMDAAIPLVQSAEELSTQYVVPLGDRIAGSTTISTAIDAAATAIEQGFGRAQPAVARLEGLVVDYIAAPLDKRLGRFSAWADQQTPATLAAGVAGLARRAADAAGYPAADADGSGGGGGGGGLFQSLRSRWAAKPAGPADAAGAGEAAPGAPADGAEFLAGRLPPPEALPPLEDPAGEL